MFNIFADERKACYGYASILLNYLQQLVYPITEVVLL